MRKPTTPAVSPITRGFPEAFETWRLELRPPMPGDGVEKRRAPRESLAELKPWLHRAQRVPTAGEAEESVRRARVAFLERTDLYKTQMLLFHRESGELVGGSGLHHIEQELPKFGIGYWLRSRFAGGGYATETVHGVAGFARAAERTGVRSLIVCTLRPHTDDGRPVAP